MSQPEIEKIHDRIVELLKEGFSDNEIKWKVFEEYPVLLLPEDLKILIAQIRNAKRLRE